MQHLEVSGAVRPLKWPLGVKWLSEHLSSVNHVFYFCGSVHLKSIYISNQQDAALSSLFILLQNHSTCFGCPLHPSSVAHKTAVTTTGASYVFRWHENVNR